MVGQLAISRLGMFTVEVTGGRGIRRRSPPSTSLGGNIVFERAGRLLLEAKDATEQPKLTIAMC
jgi:hypothetical protein